MYIPFASKRNGGAFSRLLRHFKRKQHAPQVKRYITPGGESFRLYQDMLHQPHLLIAGTTGSGKSTVLNALLREILFRFPSDVEGGAGLILIDLKRVELGRYKDLPHTICCATEPEEAVPALKHAISITESRYKAMEQNGQLLYTGADLYVVIEELADLMTTQKKAVLPLIQRLAQIGRAAKVHIIAVTQCPLRSVIPTEIGVNFDARLGLRTRNAQDSRNILGVVDGFPGLHTLPEHGQGFWSCPKERQLYNLPFISKEESERFIRHWMEQ